MVGVLVVPILVFNEAFLYHANSGMDPMLSFAANSVLLCALALVARTPTIETGSLARVQCLRSVSRPSR